MPASPSLFPSPGGAELHVVALLRTMNMGRVCLRPVAAPSCSFGAPATAAQPWALPLGPGVVRRRRGHCYNTKEHNPRASLDVAPGSAWPLLNPAKDATRLS